LRQASARYNITLNSFHTARAGRRIKLHRLARQSMHLVAISDEPLEDVAADKPSRACKENAHS
jgi:hypothetical protein